jgi:minor histocompatibility antigen H13
MTSTECTNNETVKTCRKYPQEENLMTFAYVILLSFWGISYFIAIPISLNLIVTSTTIVFIGSIRSLTLLDSHTHTGEKVEREILSSSDAYKFPIFGSCSLFGLYLAFKYLDKDMVNLVISIYFSVVGVFTITTTFSPFVSVLFRSQSKYGSKINLPYFGEIEITFTLSDLISFICSIIFSYYYFMTKHYMLNNVFGISFCIQGIERISIGSYKIGAILLCGLFFYDIFWVFGTDVMVTVAKSFDGPIKLLFPKVSIYL